MSRRRNLLILVGILAILTAFLMAACSSAMEMA